MSGIEIQCRWRSAAACPGSPSHWRSPLRGSAGFFHGRRRPWESWNCGILGANSTAPHDALPAWWPKHVRKRRSAATVVRQVVVGRMKKSGLRSRSRSGSAPQHCQWFLVRWEVHPVTQPQHRLCFSPIPARLTATPVVAQASSFRSAADLHSGARRAEAATAPVPAHRRRGPRACRFPLGGRVTRPIIGAQMPTGRAMGLRVGE